MINVREQMEMMETANKKKEKKLLGQPEGEPFGQGVIEKFDDKTLQGIDNFLITGAFAALAVSILIGVGMSASAFRVVFPQYQFKEEWTDFIENILTPSFAPVIGVFFFFSITYGLLKFAQVSSNDAVYKE